MDFNIKDLVKNNSVEFESLSASYANYSIWKKTGNNQGCYIFPVALNDIGTATLGRKEKAILFMRWIRKAIEDGTIVPFHKYWDELTDVKN